MKTKYNGKILKCGECESINVQTKEFSDKKYYLLMAICRDCGHQTIIDGHAVPPTYGQKEGRKQLEACFIF